MAAALLPPGQRARPSAAAALEAWVSSYVARSRLSVSEGWYALCAEAWAAATAEHRGTGAARGRGVLDDSAGAALSRAAIAAKYRVHLHRAHPCPGATNFTSPFHLFDYALHAKGGANKSCLLYTSPSPRDKRQSRMPSSA